MTTPILSIPEAADGEINQYLRLNEGLRILESASNSFLVLDFSAGNVTITNVGPAFEYTRTFLFIAQNNTVPRTLNLVAAIKFMAVRNSGSDVLTISLGATTINLAAGGSAFFYTDGSTSGLYKIG